MLRNEDLTTKTENALVRNAPPTTHANLSQISYAVKHWEQLL